MALRTADGRQGIRLARAPEVAFEAFVREHHERVRRVVARLAQHGGKIEAVVRQIFTELHRAHAELPSDERLAIQLYRIAVERSVSFKGPRGDGRSRKGNVGEDADPEARLLDGCIQSLSANLRVPLCLKLAGASYGEIAETLELSVDTLRTRLCLARQALAKSVARKGAHDEP